MIDLFRTGIYCRCPGGNIERPDLHSLVASWAALNVGDDPCVGRDPSVWDRQRTLYRQAGIEHGPWLHCRKIVDVEFLVSVGVAWGSPFVGLNIEDVKSDFADRGVSLQDVAQKLAAWPREIHMATLPWVQNGQGWAALSRCVAALEVFPDENEASRQPVQDLLDHAFAEGLTKVTLMFKTKEPNVPDQYDLSLSHSLYTADDIPPLEVEWRNWIGPSPCLRPSGPSPSAPVAEKIGFHDGIAASIQRLRKLDPGGTNASRDPNDLRTWKAWDKLERTLRILKDDHDRRA